MILNLALILYLSFLLFFVVGNIVVVYHLLTFRLNQVLGVFMVGLLLAGSIILFGFNLFYFSEVDWLVLSRMIVM
jgi:hypothetical protein